MKRSFNLLVYCFFGKFQIKISDKCSDSNYSVENMAYRYYWSISDDGDDDNDDDEDDDNREVSKKN